MQVQKTAASELVSTENSLRIPVQAQKNVEKNAEPCLLIHPIITHGKLKAQLIKDYSYFTGDLPSTCPPELWKLLFPARSLTLPAPGTHVGHPSPVDTVKSVSRAQSTLS